MTYPGRLRLVGAVAAVLWPVASGVAAGAAQRPPAGADREAPPAAVAVTNYADATTVRHCAALIRGTLADASATSVVVVNESSTRPTRRMTGLAHKGRFVALSELVPGANTLSIQAGARKTALTLFYTPQTNPYVIRVIYLTDNTGDTRFQTPLKDDPQDYRGKLDTAMKLMQTFTAERLHDLGFGRVTFNLELDAEGRVAVHTLRGSLSIREYHKLEDVKWYEDACRLVRRNMGNPRAKDLVILAFTRFDAEARRSYGHTALGGGDLAMFGGGDLFAWPDSLGEVQKAFMNAQRVDPGQFLSDSVGRHAFWAIASTTIGAALHELGHTLDLPHCRDNMGVMSRGFDHLNRVFTLVEPPHAGRDKPCEFKEDEKACFEPASAAWLKAGRWFALDKRTYHDRRDTHMRFDALSRSVVIESGNGIAAVVLGVGGEAAKNIPLHSMTPRRFLLPMSSLDKGMSVDNVTIRVMDAQGMGTAAELRNLVAEQEKAAPSAAPKPQGGVQGRALDGPGRGNLSR